MACEITNGRIEECKDSVSGLKAIYFINYDDLNADDVIYDVTNTDLIEIQPSTTSYLISILNNVNIFDVGEYQLNFGNPFLPIEFVNSVSIPTN